MKLFLPLLLIISISTNAQKISGTVFTSKGDLLPFSSIVVKGTTIGTTANNRAKFSFKLNKGNYTIICQHIGYATQEKQINVGEENIEVSFILNEQQLTLSEVVIKSNGEDPAYAIIRNAINKRPFYNKEVNGFSCDLYTKEVLKLRKLPKKIFGQKIPDADRTEMGLDTSGAGIIYLSESIAKVYTQQPAKFKMDVISSRVSGSNSFGFSFPSFISLYNNNVTVFTERLNPRGFVSPIADNALSLYKYKYLGTFYEDGKEVHSIKVIPKRIFEPLFSGTINICEGTWRIQSVDLFLTKTSQLEILDTLQITQIHLPVNNEVWRVKNQLLHFNFKQFGIDAVGNFLNVYSNYSINPTYTKKFFDKIIIKYDTAVSNKASTYWDTIRPVPLANEEIKDYKTKDSVFHQQNDSALTKKDIDSLNKQQGNIKPLSIFWKGIDRQRFTKKGSYRLGVESLIKSLQYNPAEGLVLNINSYYEKTIPSTKTKITVEPYFRYGFSNKHVNSWININLRTREDDYNEKLKRHTWNFAGGKRVSQFNKESTYLPITNSISTLLYGDNFMKTYENYFGQINFTKRYDDGVRFAIEALYEDRIPLNNTTNFTIFKKDSVNITPNYPTEKLTTQFAPHKAAIISLGISFKSGQRYIQLPNRKISIGSKYPLFSFNYTKGIKNIFGSNVDFDKWRFTISDDKNFKLYGKLSYKVGVGGFLNNKQLYIQDYQHFNGNRSLWASEYVNSFQLAPFYENSTNANFYLLAHAEHHFNGLITNKIPFFKQLNWNLLTGSNAFYVNKSNNYIEAFVGIENILKLLRVDVVSSYKNGNYNTTELRLGLGGILGGGIKINNNGTNRNRTVSINL